MTTNIRIINMIAGAFFRLERILFAVFMGSGTVM